MNGLEALENISITFDEGGYEPTTLGAKSGHFPEVFVDEFIIIEKALKRLEKLEKAIEILKDKFNLKVQILVFYDNREEYHLELQSHHTEYSFPISKDLYELLKEVLENDK